MLRSFKDSVTSVATCGHEVIAGSVDGAVRSFDVRTGRVITDTLHPPVTSVSLSSDSQCVLVGVLDDKIGLLDRSSGDLLAQYKVSETAKQVGRSTQFFQPPIKEVLFLDRSGAQFC